MLSRSLNSFYGTDQQENIQKESTEVFDYNKSNNLDNKNWIFIKRVNNRKQYLKTFKLHSNQRSKYSLKNNILISATQHYSYLIMTADLKISNQFNRIRIKTAYNRLIQSNNLNNYHLYSIDDVYYIRQYCYCWGITENLQCRQYIDMLEDVRNKFESSINFQSIFDYLFEQEEINQPQISLKNLLVKFDCQQLTILKNFNGLDRKQKCYQPFIFINVLDDKEQQIIYQCHNENNLYKRKYVKKTFINLNSNQVNTLIQLQKQINDFFVLLPDKKQKMLKDIFIRVSFDVRKSLCYQFDQEDETLINLISSQKFNNLTLKKQIKLIESVSIIYYLQEHLILNEDYFNENVLQVNNKGKLKINFLNSNDLNISKNMVQNVNIQKGNGDNNRKNQLIKLIDLMVQINQLKQLSVEENQNLIMLNQIIQYNLQIELLQIPQILYLFDQIQFSSKGKGQNK